jgi:hypothetical protein
MIATYVSYENAVTRVIPSEDKLQSQLVVDAAWPLLGPNPCCGQRKQHLGRRPTYRALGVRTILVRQKTAARAITHCSSAYSASACLRIGMSGSASFQAVRKF